MKSYMNSMNFSYLCFLSGFLFSFCTNFSVSFCFFLRERLEREQLLDTELSSSSLKDLSLWLRGVLNSVSCFSLKC